MTHLLYQLLYGQNAFMYKFHNADQRELQARHTRYSLQSSSLFFFQQMRSMVCTNDINEICCQSPAQHITVVLCFNTWIAFNACS